VRRRDHGASSRRQPHSYGTTRLAVNHHGLFASSTISFNLVPGMSLSDATVAVTQAMEAIHMPTSIHGVFAGTAATFQQSLSGEPVLIAAALLAVYIVLGILYESYIHPITIISTLPSAGVGAVLALMVWHTEFSIIALIGVILLIGIVKKNAIMMIDFAIHLERCAAYRAARGHSPGLPAALSAHHDDHLRGAARRVAVGLQFRQRRRIAPAPGDFHRGRPHREPGPHALHHAGAVCVSG
jgi:hypothetical protein